MDRLSHDIVEIRSRVCNLFLVAFAIMTVPALAGSLYRITTIGWLPVMAFQIVMAAGICSLALFRKRVSYNLRAGCLIATFILLGLSALWQFGLIAVGTTFVVVAPAMSVIFFGTRAGVIVLFAILLSGSLIGVVTVLEHRVPTFDLVYYATLPSNWILEIIGWALVGGSLLVAMALYNRGLITAVLDANQYQEALRESEERFRSLVENSPNAVSLKDVKGHYLLVNTQFETLFGVSRGNIIGKTADEIFEGTFAESGIEHDRKVIERKQAIEIDELFNRGDRTLRFSTTKFPIFDSGGEVTSVAAVHADLTERIEAEEALRRRESDYRQLVELSPDAVIVQCDGKIVFANQRAHAMFGARSAEDLIGLDSLSIVHPNSRDSILGKRKHVLADQVSVPPTETRHLRLDGTSFNSEFTAGPFEWNDRPATISLIRDVTDRKRAEEDATQLGQILDDSPLEIYWADIDSFRFIDVSRGARENLGYSIDELRQLTPAAIAPNFDLTRLKEQIKLLKQGQQEYSANETVHRRKDGSTYPIRLRLHLATYHGTQVLFGIAEDITERLRTEEQLRHAQKMEAVGQLTGGVAHDFNNLLAIILGNLELVEDNVVCDDDCRNHIEMAVKATERGADLTQRLLAFSRKQALRPVPVDVRKLIDGMLDLFRRSLRETIEIEIVADAGLWATEIDSGQLENALLNLAINARDAMPDGGKLTIEASNARLTDEYAAAQIDVAPGQYVLITVSDTGEGMAPELREQVFDPFFTTKEVGKGTGLGLSMVYGFVKQSGGHIAIESELGEGTTIKLYLPRYKGKEAAVERSGQAKVSISGKGETILLVEDEVDLRTMAVRMLKSLGYRTLEAGTAKAALEILRETSGVDLILTDMVLPGGMSGQALADRARKFHPNLPVLYMSGYTEEAIIQHGRLEEGVQLLEKPFRKDALASAVRKALVV